MKFKDTRRFAYPLALVTVLVSCTRAVAVETTLGPGSIPTPFEDLQQHQYRVVPGTDFIATATELLQNGTVLRGGRAIYTAGDSWVFDGGHVEGAPVTTQPGVVTADGGTGILCYSPANQAFVFNAGVFRGGSVILDGSTPAPTHAAGGAALLVDRQTYLDLKVYGGLFEGGTVTAASAPGTIITRALALALSNDYGGQVDIYGGTFNGGIRMQGLTNLTVHGTDLVLEPNLDGIFIGTPRTFTLSGKYASGETFSHTIQIDPADLGQIIRGPNFLTIAQQVPEPSAAALAAIGLAFLKTAKSQRTRRHR